MRLGLLQHAPTLAAFMLLVVVAGSLGMALASPPIALVDGETIWPVESVKPAGRDTDRDGYPDAVDVRTGDMMVQLAIEELQTTATTTPYILVGTHDDQWRLGKELQWRHIVDADPLDLDPGSRTWQDEVIRLGSWQINQPGDGESQALGTGNAFGHAGTYFLNIRDDTLNPTIIVEVWDQTSRQDKLLARLDIGLDLENRTYAVNTVANLGHRLLYSNGATSIALNVSITNDLFLATKNAIASRHAPIILFDSNERFHPTNAAVLEEFHGFKRPPPDLRTWSRSFNNGKDDYQFLLADFNGDRITNHIDATIMWDLLSKTERGAPTVYAHVTRIHDDQIALQYWFLYQYNFVLDDQGDDVDVLAHAGDREFIQLTFDNLDAALHGRPNSIAYSQHYGGIRIDQPQAGDAPYHLNDTHPAVYPARGSHASYPIPGDDAPTRRVFVGYSDHFDGAGDVWLPSNYTTEILADQEWFIGYKWGPQTRFSRDLGTTGKPLLAHDLRYPFHDPLDWQNMLKTVTPEQLQDLYLQVGK